MFSLYLKNLLLGEAMLTKTQGSAGQIGQADFKIAKALLANHWFCGIPVLPVIDYGSGAKLTKSTSIKLRRLPSARKRLVGRNKSSWEEKVLQLKRKLWLCCPENGKPTPVDAGDVQKVVLWQMC